jgi:hypothetical protein
MGSRYYIAPISNTTVLVINSGGPLEVYDIRDLELPGTDECTLKNDGFQTTYYK